VEGEGLQGAREGEEENRGRNENSQIEVNDADGL
jgi:hypothetical protein